MSSALAVWIEHQWKTNQHPDTLVAGEMLDTHNCVHSKGLCRFALWSWASRSFVPPPIGFQPYGDFTAPFVPTPFDHPREAPTDGQAPRFK